MGKGKFFFLSLEKGNKFYVIVSTSIAQHSSRNEHCWMVRQGLRGVRRALPRLQRDPASDANAVRVQKEGNLGGEKKNSLSSFFFFSSFLLFLLIVTNGVWCVILCFVLFPSLLEEILKKKKEKRKKEKKSQPEISYHSPLLVLYPQFPETFVCWRSLKRERKGLVMEPSAMASATGTTL